LFGFVFVGNGNSIQLSIISTVARLLLHEWKKINRHSPNGLPFKHKIGYIGTVIKHFSAERVLGWPALQFAPRWS